MNPNSEIPIGASATTLIEVTRELTVAHFHPGMPEVYGTPMMIYLMELAAAQAIQPHLPDGWISVGALVQITHLAATPVGLTVTARAEVVEVSDRLVTFSVDAHDGFEKIGEGKHTRATVQLSRFNEYSKRKTVDKIPRSAEFELHK